MIARAGHSCTYKVKLDPSAHDSVFGTPAVFAPSPGHVVVLMGAGSLMATCCSPRSTVARPLVRACSSVTSSLRRRRR